MALCSTSSPHTAPGTPGMLGEGSCAILGESLLCSPCVGSLLCWRLQTQGRAGGCRSTSLHLCLGEGTEISAVIIVLLLYCTESVLQGMSASSASTQNKGCVALNSARLPAPAFLGAMFILPMVRGKTDLLYLHDVLCVHPFQEVSH